MTPTELSKLKSLAEAAIKEDPTDWTFNEWEPLAKKHGFITFTGRNGFMDGYIVAYKKCIKSANPQVILSLIGQLEKTEKDKASNDKDYLELSQKHNNICDKLDAAVEVIELVAYKSYNETQISAKAWLLANKEGGDNG